MQIRAVMKSYCLRLRNGKILKKQYLLKYCSSVLENWHHKCVSQKKQNDALNAVAMTTVLPMTTLIPTFCLEPRTI